MQDEERRLALNLRRLRLRHLEILLAVERHGSLTAAAEALGASQPAVSQWLAEVEAALGVPLFLRGRQIRPSPYLPVALRHARRMVADSRQLQQELAAVAAGTLGAVRIGSMLVTSAGLLPRALLALEKQLEPLRIEVVEDTAAGLWARFERRELDLIVGRLDERAFGPHVHSEALFKDPHCAVTGRRHPLLRAAGVTWAKAATHPWILPPQHTALRRAIDATFVEQGLAPPEPWIESTSPTLNQALMRESRCIGVLSGAAAHHYQRLGMLSILPLSLGSDVGPVGMVWDRQEPSPALARVLQALREGA
ncbi:LysR substrate-binding domain-containing protein [Variovorax sp. RA8]|uniref:LysR substrate-binding domain-containing protein n=1 Tax=Variovorax sp. (strain JCM 16519 / RA8) TaxID=662548 RepID=UPI0013180279|nr:LysR substrate-binding domain-containing protein [Variovorax sp. RA8]VTU20944.1 Galactose-binding protein regulator [Variovorax sp. RA8]